MVKLTGGKGFKPVTFRPKRYGLIRLATVSPLPVQEVVIILNELRILPYPVRNLTPHIVKGISDQSHSMVIRLQFTKQFSASAFPFFLIP